MKTKRRRRKMLLVPVASMADIAFLLVIFFVVCSHVGKDPTGKIEAPTTPEVSKLDKYPMVVLIDNKGHIFFRGESVAGAEQVEAKVRSSIEAVEKARKSAGGKADERVKTVLFRCDRGVHKHVFEPVIEAIAKGGGRIAAVGETSKSE